MPLIFLTYDESGTPGDSFQPHGHGGNSSILDNCQPDSPVRGVHILRRKKKQKNDKASFMPSYVHINYVSNVWEGFRKGWYH